MNASKSIPQAAGPHARPKSLLIATILAVVVTALVTLTIAAPIAFIIGRGFGGGSASPADESASIWTCAMHPQIQLPEPGDCPICGMDLIPMTKKTTSSDPRELTMSEQAMKLADIQTSHVQRKYVTNIIRMVGKVDYDETRLADITAWVPGRLDRLYVDYTGVQVRKGDRMVTMYSPDLIVAQKELILAQQHYERLAPSRVGSSELSNVKSAEEKLRLLGLLEQQISQIKTSKTTTDQMTIYSPASGVVIQKNANEGAYVQTGTRIYTIADLSQVWVYLEAYESDITWLHYGQEVEFETESYPGEIFNGRIAFIDPVLNEKTRTVKVRVNVANTQMRLKPGMFIRARVKSSIAKGGQVIDAALAGKWISPRHPEIVKDGPGQCDICGMDLVPAEELGFVTASAGAEPALVIPATAPLITGRRAVVYVKVPNQPQPTFRGREVVLGLRVGDEYIVRHGLDEGEEVVTSGNFKIDASLQIAGGVSMMNPEGGATTTHHHGGGDEAPSDQTAAGHGEHAIVAIEAPADFRVSLNSVYSSYLAAADALANDDLATAKKQIKALTEAVDRVDPVALEADGRGRWKTTSDAIMFAAFEAADAVNRTDARKHFQELSNAMLSLVHSFGHALDQPLIQFHCPMAFDNQGGVWFQASTATRNPYFGPEMLKCGEQQATFHSQAPLIVTPGFRRQLTALYDAYLKLHLAMSQENIAEATSAVAAIQTALERIDATPLDDRTVLVWQVASKNIKQASQEDWSNLDVEKRRERFESIAAVMIGVVDSFGHDLKALFYKAHCPMAFDNRGAVWLQAQEKIVNPYFSGEMLGCGAIQRTFRPVALQQEATQ